MLQEAPPRVSKAVPRGEKARIERLIAGEEARVRRAFRTFLDKFKSGVVRRQVRRALEAGGVDAALAVIDQHAASFGAVINEVFTSAGGSEASALARRLGAPAVGLSFDPGDAVAAGLMSRARLDFIREFSDAQRAATRAVLTQALESGAGPITAARALRSSIGLTTRQLAAVGAYRRALETGDASALERGLRDRRYDASVRRLVEDGTPLGAARIDRMVDRYRQRYVQYRAETIARTETAAVVHQARAEALAQAMERLDIDQDAVVRRWIATQDARTRHTHIAMSGQERGVAEPFTSPSGARLMHPGDRSLGAGASEVVNCRCMVVFDIREDAVDEDKPPAPIVPLSERVLMPRDRHAFDLFADPSVLDEDYYLDYANQLSRMRDSHRYIPGYVDASALPTAAGRANVNTVLRTGQLPAGAQVTQAQVDELIKDMRDLVTPMDRDMTLYRGASLARVSLNVGDEFAMPGFTSTTRSPPTAVSAVRDRVDGVILQIEAPAGTRAIVTNVNELEVILDHGTRLVVREVTETAGVKLVKAEVVSVAPYVPPVDARRVDLIGDRVADLIDGVDRSGMQASHLGFPTYVATIESPSLQSYVGTGYANINRTLRSGRFDDLEAQTLAPDTPAYYERQRIRDIRELFQPSGYQMTTYRGQGGDAFPDLGPGDVFEWAGFVSTSRDPFTARSFLYGNAQPDKKGVLFQIEVPAGARVLVTNQYELEVLLDHGTRMRVVDVVPAEDVPGVDSKFVSKVYRVEIIP